MTPRRCVRNKKDSQIAALYKKCSTFYSFFISTHFITVIDLKVIKAGVNFIFDYFVGPEIENVARQDIIHSEYTLEDDDQDANRDRSSLRKKFTEIFGAIFNKQDCWRRTMCKMGNMMKDIQSKDVFFMWVKGNET